MTIFNEKGGHWYTETGENRHSTPYKSGKRKGELRATTLSDAKKENLFPSITTVLKAYPKGSLDRWIKQQMALAMFNNPPDHSICTQLDDFSQLTPEQHDYFNLIEKLSNKKRDEAGMRGTYLHDNIEAMILGGAWDDRDAHLMGVHYWMKDNLDEVILTEENVVDTNLKVAGRLDAKVRLKGDSEPIILDYKGRGFKDLKSGPVAKRYKTDPMQLSFYANATGTKRIANLFISNDRAEPEIEFYEYTPQEMEKAYSALQHFVAVWQYENGFVPELSEGGE